MVCTSWINLYMYTYREYFTHPQSVKDVLKHGVLTVDLAQKADGLKFVDPATATFKHSNNNIQKTCLQK